MHATDGHRRAIAAALIAVLILGLGLVLILAGLPTAANVVQVLGTAAIVTPLIVWARADTRAGPTTRDETPAVDHRKQLEIREDPQPPLHPLKPSTQQRPSLRTAATFRSPVPWAQWAAFSLVAAWLISTTACMAIGIQSSNIEYSTPLAFGIFLIVVGFVCILFDVGNAIFGDGRFFLGNIFREIFKFRLTLVIGEEGISYHWNSKHVFSRSWKDIALITSDSRHPSAPHLVVVVKNATSEDTSAGHAICLCRLDSPGFSADEVRAVIASLHASALDPKL
jgi:hypothetical protein